MTASAEGLAKAEFALAAIGAGGLMVTTRELAAGVKARARTLALDTRVRAGLEDEPGALSGRVGDRRGRGAGPDRVTPRS